MPTINASGKEATRIVRALSMAKFYLKENDEAEDLAVIEELIDELTV